MASKLPARNGSPLAAATTMPARPARPSAAAGGRPQSFQGQVGEDHLAAAGGRQVQAGPAPPGADVEQAIGSRQAQLVGEGVGLGPGGVAVGAPVAADDPPFDLAGHRRQGDAVALLEQRSCLELIFDRHVAYLPGRVLGPSWLGATVVASGAR